MPAHHSESELPWIACTTDIVLVTITTSGTLATGKGRGMVEQSLCRGSMPVRHTDAMMMSQEYSTGFRRGANLLALQHGPRLRWAWKDQVPLVRCGCAWGMPPHRVHPHTPADRHTAGGAGAQACACAGRHDAEGIDGQSRFVCLVR